MTHKRGKKPQPRLPLTGYCAPCDKVRYVSRADARKAARSQGARQRVYVCPEDDTFWHRATWQPQGRVSYYREVVPKVAPDQEE